MAVNRNYNTSDGERREETEWFRVVAWERLAETCSQYLSKGRQVYVEGRLQTRSWDDKDGVKRYMTEVIAQNVSFLGSKRDSENGPPAAAPAAPSAVPSAADAEGDIDPDDLPF